MINRIDLVEVLNLYLEGELDDYAVATGNTLANKVSSDDIKTSLKAMRLADKITILLFLYCPNSPDLEPKSLYLAFDNLEALLVDTL